MKACASMHIANNFGKCAHLSLFCPNTDKPSCCIFPSVQGSNHSLCWSKLALQMGSISFSELPLAAHCMHRTHSWTGTCRILLLPPFSSSLTACPDTTTIPEGTAVLLLPFVTAQQQGWGGQDKPEWVCRNSSPSPWDYGQQGQKGWFLAGLRVLMYTRKTQGVSEMNPL